MVAILGFFLMICFVRVFPNIVGWILMIIFRFWYILLILFIVGLIMRPKHHHYCDTCIHGIWKSGGCYCEVKDKQISNIKGHAGCRSWFSRR